MLIPNQVGWSVDQNTLSKAFNLNRTKHSKQFISIQSNLRSQLDSKVSWIFWSILSTTLGYWSFGKAFIFRYSLKINDYVMCGKREICSKILQDDCTMEMMITPDMSSVNAYKELLAFFFRCVAFLTKCDRSLFLCVQWSTKRHTWWKITYSKVEFQKFHWKCTVDLMWHFEKLDLHAYWATNKQERENRAQ